MGNSTHTGPAPVNNPCRSTGAGPSLQVAAIPILAAGQGDTTFILAVTAGLLALILVWHHLAGAKRRRRSQEEDDALSRRAFGGSGLLEDDVEREESWLRRMQKLDPEWGRRRLGHPREREDRTEPDERPSRKSRVSIRH